MQGLVNIFFYLKARVSADIERWTGCGAVHHNTFWELEGRMIHYDTPLSSETNFYVGPNEMISLRVSEMFNGLVRDLW